MEKDANKFFERLLLIIGAAATVFSCYVAVLAFSRPEVRESLAPFIATSEPQIKEVPVIVEVTREIPVTVVAESTVVERIITAPPSIVEVPVTVVVSQIITAPPAPTYTPLPSLTPWPTYTDIPGPTSTFTDTPSPSPSPAPTLDPRLEVGESWEQDNIRLTLEDAILRPRQTGNPALVKVYLTLENNTDRNLFFSWNGDNLRLVDNLGFTYADNYWCMGGDISLAPGKKYKFDTCGWGDGLNFQGDSFFNKSVTELTLTVTDVSRIAQARWKINVPH